MERIEYFNTQRIPVIKRGLVVEWFEMLDYDTEGRRFDSGLGQLETGTFLES